MSVRTVVLTFFAVVLAVFVGWFVGGFAHDAVGTGHQVAIGVVDAQAGAPVATESPAPATTTSTSLPSDTPFGASPAVDVSPSPEASIGSCPGTPPGDHCFCRQRKRNSRWVCPLLKLR